MRTLPAKIALGILCLSPLLVINSTYATEQDELALIIKQLTQVKASLIRSEIVSGTEQTGRYHFNYEAAQTDINQVIQGIERYLSPTRPQPRHLHLTPLTVDYQGE